MKTLNLRVLLLRRFSIPKDRAIRRTLRSFTMAERAVFYFFVSIFIFTGVALVWKVNNAFTLDVPTRGGKLSEGIIGNPRFINPVLAISEADRNLTALIYSGLVRITPDHKTIPDLAEEIIISENGLVYTAKIREDARFHDGNPVTADDVVFTIGRITDPLIKSPKRGNWEGVAINKIDERTVEFRLKKAYAPFIENLSIGILSKANWKDVSADEFAFSQFNTLPVGSGPYKVKRVERNSGGIPDYYRLEPFDGASGTRPFIKNLNFYFYPSEDKLLDAHKNGEIESMAGISPEHALELETAGTEIVSAPLPRVFGVFFNQNQSKILLEKEVRQALDLSSPKEDIVKEILNGYGSIIDGPLPPGTLDKTGPESRGTYHERLERAKSILDKAGWVANADTGVLEKKGKTGTMVLSFSISTGDAPELRSVAAKLAQAWQELGAQVEIKVFETGDLNQNVIRPRAFDALLFGEVVGRDADVYPFWHSSQRNDPGLNIALYANGRVDRLLEEARSELDEEGRNELYRAFDQELKKDLPAVFLYSPSFLYILPEKVKSVALGGLSTSQDRFLGVRDWYIETDKVWKIFVN